MLKKMTKGILMMFSLNCIQNASTQEIKNLSELTQYKTMLVDIVGVVYDGINPFEKAIAALNKAQNEGYKLVFMSNNPRPSSLSRANIIKMGFVGDVHISTSGDYARWCLEGVYKGKKIYHLGAKKNKDILKDLDVIITDSLQEADIILLTTFIEETEDPDQFDEKLKEIALSKKVVLCANPDVYASYGSTLRKCAGFFAQKIEQFGGKVEYLGKPNPKFYEYVCKIHNINLLQKDKILMIGDTLYTDIKGAKNFGIDSLLVLSGISCDFNTKNPYEYLPTYISRFLS